MMNKLIRVSLIVVPLVAFASAARAEELKDPVEILKKADAACKQTKAVSYDASFKGRGADEKKAPVMTGSVVFSGFNHNAPAKFRVNAKIQPPDSSEVVEITAATDGDKYVLIDSKTKKMHEDIDAAVMGSRRRQIGRLWMLELVHPEAYKDEINGEKKELKESAKVGNEDCYQVYVKYSAPGQEANWFFSKKDFLPRKVERIFTPPGGESGGGELTVTNLSTSPKMEPDPFKPAAPEGYTKTDDFAP